MSRVKSENTSVELLVFKILDRLKIKYKKHFAIPGKPDIAFPKNKVAVFINGEFWHGRNYGKEKERYPEFWIEKIGKNIKRDRKNYKLLKNGDWKIIKIWDKDLKRHTIREINKILKSIGYDLFKKSDLEV